MKHLQQLLAVLTALLACSQAQDCAQKIQEFFQCKAQAKSSLPPRPPPEEKGRCFTEAGCALPEWHRGNMKEFFECVHQVAQQAQTDCEESEGLPDFPDVGEHGHYGHHGHHGGKGGKGRGDGPWAAKKEQMLSEACEQDEAKIAQVKACFENKKESMKGLWESLKSQMEACRQNLEPCTEELQSQKETLCSCMTDRAENDEETRDALAQCDALKGDATSGRFSSNRLFGKMCRSGKKGWGKRGGSED